MKTEFEKKLKELDFSFHCHTDDFYILNQNNDTNSILNVHFIMSEPVDEVIHGSRNNNEIQAIGYFKLEFQTEVKEPDFFILAFRNTSNHSVEFIIIPKKELMRRLNKENRISTDNQGIEIEFWLTPDKCLYETKDVGVEWEWFYMSKGQNGRLADKTDWCYTKFLNGWDRLKMA